MYGVLVAGARALGDIHGAELGFPKVELDLSLPSGKVGEQ